MDERYIAAAVPFFFSLIGVELWLSRRRGQSRYRFHDAIASMSCGIGQQIVNIAFGAIFIGAYAWVYERFAIAHPSPRSPFAWLFLLFAVDLAYYSSHRANHRVNFLWAGHAVHHQSEEYNLSTALRQSWLESLLGTPFYWWLAIAGFPPAMFLTMLTVNTLYQFWIHTRMIGRLGWLDGFLNTPSNHRVHHGVDPAYIDKNFGGMFAIWDRLLGTYAREEKEPIFGTVKPLASFNPVWANLAEWARMLRMARATGRLRDRVWVWFAPPEWRPSDLGGVVIVPEVDRDHYRKYGVTVPRAANAYVMAHFAVVTAATTALLWFHPALSLGMVMASGAWILAAVLVWGGLFEKRRWATYLEMARLATTVGIAAWVAREQTWFAPVVVGALAGAALSALWLVRVRSSAFEPAVEHRA